jgi:hypothetical protein
MTQPEEPLFRRGGGGRPGRLRPAALGLALLLLAGCGRDEPIGHYTVAKEPGQKPSALANAPQETRALAAILARPDATWFFKLSGPPAAVAGQRDAFERLVQSVKFPPGGLEIDWQLPPGWSREPGTPGRFATLRIKDEKAPSLAATVVKLGPDAGSLLANVNRWRGQIGLGDVDEGQLKELVREVKTDAGTVQMVDMTGPGVAGGGGMGMPPPGGGGLPPVPAAPDPPELKYDRPAGWAEGPPKALAAKTFVVGSGARTATVTLTPLGGPAGGVAPNVNRWRDQVGLPPLGEAELLTEARQVPAGGGKGLLYDLTSPPGKPPRRIVVVIRPAGDQTWFIKMDGPPDLVGEHLAAFESFLKSLRIGGGRGQS